MHENWRILVVEDDRDIHRLVNDKLRSAGFEVSAVYDGQAALDLIQREGLPHLAILDIRLPDPDLDGLDLAEEFGQRGVPVIIITAYDSRETVLKSLSKADDYLRKPFEPDELVARVRRVLSRIGDYSYAVSPMLDVDERVRFDYTNNALVIGGERVSLTPIESRLLHTLMQHRGKVVDGRALIARVWSSDNIYEDTLRVHIHRLRSKLEVDPRHPRYILTERGIGYSFAS